MASPDNNAAKMKTCRVSVGRVFPDISADYLAELMRTHGNDPDVIINQIMDKQEQGRDYAKKEPLALKRKRGDGHANENGDWDEALAELRKYDNPKRRQTIVPENQEFPQVPADEIQPYIEKNNRLLLPAYLELENALSIQGHGSIVPKVAEGQQASTALMDNPHSSKKSKEASNKSKTKALERLRLKAAEELQAARQIRAKREQHREQHRERQREHQKQQAEAKKETEEAIANDQVAECACCFNSVPLTSAVFCDGERLMHMFCRLCARQNATTAIGLMRYELQCMSTDGCSGSFSQDQRATFLEPSDMKALDRLEAEAAVREAGVENLERCPYCDFMAQYPPVEKAKIFECLSPDCRRRSCRLCRKEDHLPKLCHELQRAVESGRHQIEEAMSAAMIRVCNKCNTPFIKEHGCNKMTCAKCGNRQCYVCGANAEYSHFAERSGGTGTCKLYHLVDGTDAGYGFMRGSTDIHKKEVEKASEIAKRKVLDANPELDAKLFDMSVKADEKSDTRHDLRELQRGDQGFRQVAHLALEAFGPGGLPQENVHAPAQRPLIPQPGTHNPIPHGARLPQSGTPQNTGQAIKRAQPLRAAKQQPAKALGADVAGGNPRGIDPAANGNLIAQPPPAAYYPDLQPGFNVAPGQQVQHLALIPAYQHPEDFWRNVQMDIDGQRQARRLRATTERQRTRASTVVNNPPTMVRPTAWAPPQAPAQGQGHGMPAQAPPPQQPHEATTLQIMREQWRRIVAQRHGPRNNP